MTIITNNILADKPVYEKLLIENELKSIEKNIASTKVAAEPSTVIVSTGTRLRTISHRGLFFYILAALLGLAILAAGVFLAIFVFQQVRASHNVQLEQLKKQPHRQGNFKQDHQVYRFKCEVEMFRHLNTFFARREFLQENVRISADNEFLSIPQWNQQRGASILQSFQHRITAVLDHANHVCFIKPMNPKIQPPANMEQLIRVFMDKEYIPKASVVRQYWRAKTPSLSQAQVSKRFGSEIADMCAAARATYILEPRISLQEPRRISSAVLPLCPMIKCKACPAGFYYGRTEDGCAGCNCIKERVQPEACLKMQCMCADERYLITYNDFGCKTCQCFKPLIRERKRRTAEKFTQVLLPDTYVTAENPVIFELVVDIPEEF